jgi:hypothetical protein
MSKVNLSESFSKLMETSYIRYRGCLIELPEYKVFGKPYQSLAAAQAQIDNAFSSLKNTIR